MQLPLTGTGARADVLVESVAVNLLWRSPSHQGGLMPRSRTKREQVHAEFRRLLRALDPWLAPVTKAAVVDEIKRLEANLDAILFEDPKPVPEVHDGD
jgi:hypothetical protein